MKKKAKTVSKIAKGRLANYLVMKGAKEKTVGGLTKADLIINKKGQIVSKKRVAAAKKGKASKRIDAVVAAREYLGIKGFQVVGGDSPKGKDLLAKARAIYTGIPEEEEDSAPAEQKVMEVKSEEAEVWMGEQEFEYELL